MYVRKKKLQPFLPSSKSHDMASAADLFPPKVPAHKEVEYNLDAFKDSMRDAETGEPIVLSKAGWNVREGRLNLNTQTILAMGTGRLDIKNRIKEKAQLEPPKHTSQTSRNPYAGRLSPIYSVENSTKCQSTVGATPLAGSPRNRTQLRCMDNLSFDNFHSYNGSGVNSPTGTAISSANITRQNTFKPDVELNAALLSRALQSIPHTPNTASSALVTTGTTGHRRHPLLTQYLKEGPLNAMHHRYWDARSNTVIPEDEEGNPLDVAEEGVEYSGGEEEDDQLGDLGTHLSPLGIAVADSTLSGGDGSSVGSSSSSITASIASRSIRASQRTGLRGHNRSSRSLKGSDTASSRLRNVPISDPALLDKTIGVVDPAIVLSNKRTWQATEEKYFQELFALGWQYENNKSLTKEQRGKGGLAEVRQTARAIARLKVKGMLELVQAYADEKLRDEKRMELESDNTHPNKVKYLAELMKLHEEERKKSRRYLHALEHDNEVMLIRKLSDTGWLW
eukprot:gene15915-18178_t